MYYERTIRYNPHENRIIIDIPKGNFRSKFTRLKFILHGFDNINAVKINEKTENIFHETISFLDPISAFEPQATITKLSECRVVCIEIENNNNEIIVNY
jgi:hypothetical protein